MVAADSDTLVAPRPQDVAQNGVDILLVDDEQDILDVAVAVLEGAGYRVQTALNGDIALVVLGEPIKFRLLLTDIVMPGELDGFALAREARRIQPEIGIIYATGFPRTAARERAAAPPGALLVKPWRARDLLSLVGETLSPRG